MPRLGIRALGMAEAGMTATEAVSDLRVTLRQDRVVVRSDIRQ